MSLCSLNETINTMMLRPSRLDKKVSITNQYEAFKLLLSGKTFWGIPVLVKKDLTL